MTFSDISNVQVAALVGLVGQCVRHAGSPVPVLGVGYSLILAAKLVMGQVTGQIIVFAMVPVALLVTVSVMASDVQQ